MTGDFRERLKDLAAEMEPLHAPRNLEARVLRREVSMVAAGVAGVLAIVLIAVAGVRTLDQANPSQITPANPQPFPVAATPIAATEVTLRAPEDLMVDKYGNL